MTFGQRVRRAYHLVFLSPPLKPGPEKAKCGRAPADAELQNASPGVENPSAWPTTGCVAGTSSEPLARL